MALSLYFDVHVPAAITEGLHRRGIDVITSQQDATSRISDEDLFGRAASLGRLLFSQDADLLEIAARWQADGRPFAGLVFGHQQGTSIGRSVEDLELICQCLAAEEAADRVIFIPLS